jgi:hypothetical protein
MSHRIIITSEYGGSQAVDSDGTLVPVKSVIPDYRIEFAPPHDMKPEQVSRKVAHILRLIEKMGDDE